MPRIRSVKPEYFTHPEVVEVSIPARLLFVSLLTQADDDGRLYDQPRKIAGNSFGDNDDINVNELLDELARFDRIVRYKAEGKACIQIVHFDKHQVIPPSKRRPSAVPRLPRGSRKPATEQTNGKPLSDIGQDDDSETGARNGVELEPGSGTGTGNLDLASSSTTTSTSVDDQTVVVADVEEALKPHFDSSDIQVALDRLRFRINAGEGHKITSPSSWAYAIAEEAQRTRLAAERADEPRELVLDGQPHVHVPGEGWKPVEEVAS